MFYRVNVRRGTSYPDKNDSILARDLRGRDISKYEPIDEVIVKTCLFNVKEIVSNHSYKLVRHEDILRGCIPLCDFVFEEELIDSNMVSFGEVKEYMDTWQLNDRSFCDDIYRKNRLKDRLREQNQIKQYIKRNK